jgi:N-formylglutamate amidohydrolase
VEQLIAKCEELHHRRLPRDRCRINPTSTWPDRIFGSGPDDWHTLDQLHDELVVAASAAGLSVLVDRPFTGALVPPTHYRRGRRVRAVMIEINRQLYMDEEAGEQLPNFGEIR